MITEYAQKYQLYKLSDADQTEYDQSGDLVEAEPAEFADVFKESLIYGPLGNIYTGNKHATYVSGCGWYYETLADVISNEEIIIWRFLRFQNRGNILISLLNLIQHQKCLNCLEKKTLRRSKSGK